MEKKLLLKGAEAIGEAAIRSGCNRFYGYPVPNQSDLLEYLVKEEEEGRSLTVFQSEDPLSSLFMAYGASIAGARVLTAANSIDLPDALRAVSYFSAADLPLVCAIFSQSGPGSGNIYPEQSDTLGILYGTQIGDGFASILTPSTPSDCAAATYKAFQTAEAYHIPVIILVDAACAQLVETVDFSTISFRGIPKNRLIIKGKNKGDKSTLTTLALDIERMAERKSALNKKRDSFLKKEQGSYKLVGEGEENLIVAFGISAIQAKRTADALIGNNISCTLFEPTSLYPFPEKPLEEALKKAKRLFAIDMSNGQIEKVLTPYIPDSVSLHVFSTTGGAVPRVEQVRQWIQQEIQSS